MSLINRPRRNCRNQSSSSQPTASSTSLQRQTQARERARARTRSSSQPTVLQVNSESVTTPEMRSTSSLQPRGSPLSQPVPIIVQPSPVVARTRKARNMRPQSQPIPFRLDNVTNTTTGIGPVYILYPSQMHNSKIK